ncbi:MULTISPECIES: arabinose transporter [unclassified Desulfovibrio]|uniref:arabinose transporter n=1 Tax=unclassified Desulfovibrio TaxID=2593640 RepID=UPI002FDA0034
MATPTAIHTSHPHPLFSALGPLVGTILVSFLVIGLAMPVIPLHVHEDLGLPTLYVGLVAGAQFGASFLSRFWAGVYADTKGAKRSMMLGLVLAALAGGLYYLSLFFMRSPYLSMTVLLFGRAVLGAGESFIITGASTWGIIRAGANNTGMVLSWVGTAMYIAYAVGAPLGTMLFSSIGFQAISLATFALPLLAMVFIAPLPAALPIAKTRASLNSVLRAVWVPGVGLAFSSVGFGAITTFIVLLFAQHGWDQAWLAFSLLSIFFMLGRVCFGHLPDKIGGAKVALTCLIIEASGQACIWLAPDSLLAFIGAALTGLGYSLVYPGLGVEAVQAAAPEQRGVAMGAYTAFLDLALGISGPALGLIAGISSVSMIYGVSTMTVLCSGLVAYRIMINR